MIILMILLVLFTLLSGCDKQDNKDAKLDLNKSNSRSFYMGMTPFPFDVTTEAVQETYDITDQLTDLIAHHFDSGLPWDEALNETDYHPNVANDIKFRASKINKTQKVYLAVTPISTMRDGLALYRGENGNMELPDNWKDKQFDDEGVIKAYLNYCRLMINELQPDFMCYGIEANLLANKDYEAYEKYLTLAKTVYETLKLEYPDLPIFQSIQLEEFKENIEEQKEIVKELLTYSDYIAVSTYPFILNPNPEELKQSFLEELIEIDPDKPFAIAETTYIAEKLVLESKGVEIEGNEEWQSQYVDYLLKQCNEYDAEFMVWFVPKDYDELWVKFSEQGIDETFKLWRDSGLIDENDLERNGKAIWQQWLELPKR